MKNGTILRVILLGALAVMGILTIQTYLLMNTWNAEEKEFEEKVTIALQNVAKEFEKLGTTIPTYDLIIQTLPNYYVVNINDFIDANNLEIFLRREMEAVGMREDFEYGIYNCDTRKMAYGNYITYSAEVPEQPKNKVEQLPVPVEAKFPYYFGVRFPNRTSEILSGMRLTLIFSAILLVTILFFLYSMFIILRQKRLSEMQKDFINNMTHEFKTPISTIKISADTFLNSPEIKENERLLQYANIISEQNNRLNGQVEKVLQLAKIERDNFKLHLEKLDLHDLLKSILASAKIQVEKQGGTLDCQLTATHFIVNADRLHLTNIIHNLLDNAVKYCREKPHITIKTENISSGKLRLKVVDKGLGIAKEYAGKIFEKFYRVPTGNVHNVKGFGLGLFYTKNICDAHGWKISLDSEAGKGTAISITI